MNYQYYQLEELSEIARNIAQKKESPMRRCVRGLLVAFSLSIIFYYMAFVFFHSHEGFWIFFATVSILITLYMGANLLDMIWEGSCTWEGRLMCALARYTPTEETAYRELSNALIDEGVDINRVMIWLGEERDRLEKMRAVESPHKKCEIPAVKRLRDRVVQE